MTTKLIALASSQNLEYALLQLRQRSNKTKLCCACRCSWCNMEILIRNLKYTSVFLNLKRYKICNILNTNITQLESCTSLNFASYAKLLEICPRIIFMLVGKVCMELKSCQCLDLGFYNFFLFLKLNFQNLFYIPTTFSSPSSPPTSSSTSFLPPSIHFSERVRPPIGVNQAWHSMLRKDQAPLHCIKAGKGIPS